MNDLSTLLASLDADRSALRERVRALEYEQQECSQVCTGLEIERDALRTLVERQREALRDISEHLPCDLPCKMKPAAQEVPS